MNRYKHIDIKRNKDGIRYRKNPIYPTIPLSEDDIYIITTGGDRYDTLAQQFYNDASLWWIIASANVSKRDGLIVEPGVQLRIPANSQQALRLFSAANENR